jgi:dipeptidyl aminopeptidase/acylaminoacyl peptidase
MGIPRRAERTLIGGLIPALIWRAPAPGPRPAIIYLPGGGQTKEDVIREVHAQALDAGVTVVSFDMAVHGERQHPRRAREAQVTMDDFLDFVETTTADLRVVVDALHADDSIDAARIGLRGISLSASAMLSAIAQGLEAAACLAICGAGDFAAAGSWRLQRDGLTSEETADALQRVSGRLHRVDPLHSPDRFPPCAVMLVHGLADESVPYHSGYTFWQALAPYYTDRPQDCVFLSHPGRHGIRDDVRRTTWLWLLERIGR